MFENVPGLHGVGSTGPLVVVETIQIPVHLAGGHARRSGEGVTCHNTHAAVSKGPSGAACCVGIHGGSVGWQIVWLDDCACDR